MTYKEFCDNIGAVKAEEKRLNEWREKALQTLLTKIAPKVAKYRNHDHLKTLGKLFTALALPVEFTPSNCHEIADICTNRMIDKVLYDSLVRDTMIIARLNCFGQDISNRKHSWGATDIVVFNDDSKVKAFIAMHPETVVWEADTLEQMVDDIQYQKHIKKNQKI